MTPETPSEEIGVKIWCEPHQPLTNWGLRQPYGRERRGFNLSLQEPTRSRIGGLV